MKFNTRLVYCILIGCGLTAKCRADDRLLAEVRRELARSLEEFQHNTARPIRAMAVSGMTSDSAKYTGSQGEATTLVSGANTSEKLLIDGYNPNHKVYGRNSRYVFELTGGKNKQSWLLTAIGKPGDPAIAEAEKSLRRTAASIPHVLDHVLGVDGQVTLLSLFESKDFMLKSAARTSQGGAIVIKFTRKGKTFADLKLRDTIDTVIECEYTFDPDKRWLPITWAERVIEPAGGGNVTCTRNIEVLENRYVVTSKFVQHITTPFHANMTNSSKFEVEYGVDIPESEFTLSAYGLPEPSGFEPPPTPLYIWLLLAAGVCAAVAVGFRLLARRRAA